MTPLTKSSAPSVVNSRSRYARRFSSVDSTPIESKRFLIVPLDSSAARIPLPEATSACAISSSDVVWMAICPPRLSVSRLALSPCGYRGLDRNVLRRPNGVTEEQDHVQQDRARSRAQGAPGAE